MNNHFFQVLRIKPFLFLWLAEIFSQVAMNMVNFILLIVAYKLTNSNAAVSGIVISFTIPAIIFGMLAGVFVDRWGKKKVLFATNAIRTLLLIALVFLHTNIVSIYVLSFVIAVVTQFFIPAETPMIPKLVKKDLLLSANALFGMGIYGSILIAYGLSSPLLLLLGETNIFILLAVLFLCAAIFVLFIKQTKKTEKTKSIEYVENKTFIYEIKSALKVMAKTKAIYHSLILLTLSQIIILILAVIGPGFAEQVLNIKVDEFPLYFITPAAFGMVFGALLLGNFSHEHSKHASATWGVFLLGITVFLLPYGSQLTSRDFIHTLNMYLPAILSVNILHIMILLAFIMGVANALIFVPSNTILQEETSDEFRGRVYGVLNAMTGIFSLFPIIIVGELADIFGVGRVITGIGITILCIGISRLIFAIRK